MAKDPKFIGTITYSLTPVAGVTVHRDRTPELSLEEMMEDLGKEDLRGAKIELLLSKIRERIDAAKKGEVAGGPSAQPNPKRYLVDPGTGRIDVDEAEGEYTYKDALLVSASIKGKDGGYEGFLNLVKTIKELEKGSEVKTTEKPKEYLVDPETGIIEHDRDNGELTLSEARAISQSLQKGAGQGPPIATFINEEGHVEEVKPGYPVVIRKETQQPGKTYFVNAAGDLVEQEAGKPIIIKVEPAPGGNLPQFTPFPAMDREGKPVTDKEGRQLYVDIEPQMKWTNFQNEQRRADERHGALMGIAKEVRENLGSGIEALKRAAARAKGTGGKPEEPKQQQSFECGQCHTSFSPPPEWDGKQNVRCPNCQREYTKEDLVA